ncbi:MAG: substrate-binding domain-containing protein [Clostridia bacterium]|nr:substrate-binding domain-containing protein [Clostridia bacterium]
MADKKTGTLIARGGLIAALVFLALPGYLFLALMMMGMPPYWQRVIPILAGMGWLLMILLAAGLRRKKWFRSVLALCGAVVLGCTVYVGLGMYEDSIPTVDDRSLMLSEYQPFHGEKTTVLPEEATLRFTQEQADSFVIDGATALYPVYAAFVQAVYPEGEYSWYDHTAGVLCSGTNTAYDDLMSGEVDVIFVAQPSGSQQIAAEQAGLQLHLTPIGREAFVFFVNSANPVTDLTFEQVAGICAGEITNWKAVGGRNASIRAYQRPEGSGSQTGLQLVMRTAGKAIMEPRMEDVAASMGGIVSRVATYRNHENAIGYTYRFYANEMVANDQIRLLSLNGVAPTKETIRDGSYPISSCFYAVTCAPIGQPAPEETNPDLGAFLAWCQGEQGQWLVEKVGYVGVDK